MSNENLPCVFPLRTAADYDRIEARIMRVLRRYAEFEADWSRWYREGDGRSVAEGGKGHRYPYACIHGASAYTDYDNICGPCEGGYGSWDYARELEEAARDLRWANSQVHKRAELLIPVMGEAWGQLSKSTRDELTEWALKPLTEFN